MESIYSLSPQQLLIADNNGAMKMSFARKKKGEDGGIKIFSNDTAVKLVGIPLLGIGLPNITGLITNALYDAPALCVSYLLFIGIAWAIWEGNTRLMLLLKNTSLFKKKSYQSNLLFLFSAVIFYTTFISFITLFLWHSISKENASLKPLWNTAGLITVIAVFITNLYESFFLNREHHDTQHRIEQLNIAKTHVELTALKNQIDPHFIFNSLNTLSYLISSDAENAKLYNDTLAKVYQYILRNREKNLVLLAEEIEFMSNYFYLLRIRFDKAVNMVIEINDADASELLIPPISLQILIENVMKHNRLETQQPLTVNTTVSSGFVVVTNDIHPKAYPETTSRVGLANLDNRYKLLTGKNIAVQQTAHSFSVKLPLTSLN